VQGFIGQGIQPPGMNILFELFVPGIGVKFMKPTPKGVQFVARKLAHGGFDFIHCAHVFKINDWPNFGKRSQPNISGEMIPSATFVTGPVMRIENSSPISIWMTPPGMWTEIFRSTQPSLCATAAAALLLLPLASV